jgi:hypothetical protein
MTLAVEMSITYTATDEAVESRLGEETVILHLGSGTYFGLDAVGTRVWELLREGATPQAICASLREEFEDTGEALEADILGFLGQLAENRLIGPA